MALSITSDMAAQAGVAQDVQQKIRLEELRNNLTPRESSEKKLRGACQGFESVFINNLLTQMRSSIPKDGLLHSKYEDQYLSMFDQEMADKISKDGGIGIAQMMYDQLSGKLHPKTAALPINGDIYASHAVNRFPLPKSKGFHSDITPKDGMLSLPGASRHQASPSSPLGSGQNASDQSQAAQAQTQAQASAQPGLPMATPCDGEISSPFGWRTDPVSGRRAWHSGVDIQAAQGTPVDACWNGKVVFAGDRGGYGKCVVVEHDGGWQSIYGHNSNILVHQGETARAGQKIAEVGNTGKATGAHLHFELRRDGVAYDPIQVQMAALSGSEQSRDAGGETLVASI
jgi:murein DD-endopeptidase MepM/ murein hydrolase activator NlpD